MSELEHQPFHEEPGVPLGQGLPDQKPVRKPYGKPGVVYEARLEVRAGTPLVPPPFDPFDLTQWPQ